MDKTKDDSNKKQHLEVSWNLAMKAMRLILWHKWSLSSSLDTKSATPFAKQRLYECGEKTKFIKIRLIISD